MTGNLTGGSWFPLIGTFFSGLIIAIVAAFVKAKYDAKLEKAKRLIEKKYEVCNDIYVSFRKAEGALLELLSSGSDIRSLNEADVKKYLEPKRASQKEIDKIIKLMNQNIRDAQEEMLKIINRYELQEKRMLVSDANNKLVLSRLFLTEETFKIGIELVDKMFDLLLCQEYKDQDSAEDIKRLRKEIPELIDKLFKQMKSDLDDVKIKIF